MKILVANLPWKLDKNQYGVRAGSRWPHTRDKKRDTYYYPFPIYLAYATSILQTEGFGVFAKDYLTLGLGEEELLRDIKNCDLLLAETSTITFMNDIRLCEKIKHINKNCKVVFCGPHATVFPEQILENHKCVDYVLTGEYDYTIRELCEKLSKCKSVKNILGLAFRQNNKVYLNNRRPLIANLNELPSPAWEFFPMKKYNDAFCRGHPNVTMISSRGCPYNCIYCLEPNIIYGGSNYRYRSSENIINEMEEIIKTYRAKEIYFDDASFMIGNQRVIDFCEDIKKSGLKVNWSCMGDTIYKTEEVVKAMAEAGCVAIKFGVESADEQILKNINKKINLQQTKDFVRWCKKYKIKTHATYMFGLPGETKTTIKKTTDYALNLNTDTAQFAIATPYPGTPFYKWALSKGHLNTKEWELYDGNVTPVIKIPNISNKELAKALKYAQNKYWLKIALKPGEAITFFENIYKRDGFFALLQGITNKIKWLIEDVLTGRLIQ